MITIPELVSQALGSFLTSETKGRFGSSHAGLTELLPFAARLTLECIGNSDALYHNIEHSMLVTLAGHDILTGRAYVAANDSKRLAFFKRGPSSRDGTISKKENQMKSKIAYPALAATALLASTQLAAAQGTSGGTGAIASIPGSVARGHERAWSYEHYHRIDSTSALCFQGTITRRG